MMRKSLDAFTVSMGGSLRDAMWTLERGAGHVALVMDDDARLAGILTDGDVRRALLRGASLDSPLVSNVKSQFVAVDPQTGRAEVLDIMQARKIGQIPVVDGNRRLLGLHLLHELIGHIERPNWAVIMAGGKGTRLAPVTDRIPKPMIPVAGRPILERLVLHLVGFGVERIYVAVNHLGHLVEEHFGNGERHGCRIEYLRETKPLGTGGPLSMLPELPNEPILVLNGDLVTQADVGSMLGFHERGGYQCTVAVKQYTHTVPYGCAEIDSGRIVHFEEKPVLGRMVNTGICVLNPSVVARVPEGREYPLTALLEQSLSLGEPIGAFEVMGDWIDVGLRDQLQLAMSGGQ